MLVVLGWIAGSCILMAFLGWWVGSRPTLFQQLVHGLAGHDPQRSAVAAVASTYGRSALGYAFEWAQRDVASLGPTAMGRAACLGKTLAVDL